MFPYLVLGGEEGFKLVLYIEGLFGTGRKVAKEDCLNSVETGRGLLSSRARSVTIVFPGTPSSLSTEQNEESSGPSLDYVMCNRQNRTYSALNPAFLSRV